jgi:predicted GH43/DUF377 family glycosyl hydrolase
MSKKRFLLVFLSLLLSSMMLHAQDDVEITPLFDLYSPEPVIAFGTKSEWDGQYTDPGAVVYHDGKFHMFRNGFKGWPASVEIGYLTSEDGFNWTEVTPDPVIYSKDVALTKLAVLASSVLVEDDGTWILYAYTWNTRNSLDGEGAIVRATAPDPLGPWTFDETPALEAGKEGTWDETQVDSPSVLKTDDGYMMWYTGRDRKGTLQIGLAMSDDGITWTKHPDPVLTADLPWEAERASVHQPRVVETPDGFVMVYRMPGRGSKMRLGVATSADGIAWTKRDAPVFGPEEISPSGQFWYTALAYKDATYYLYIEANHKGGTSIFATSYDGDLFAES